MRILDNYILKSIIAVFAATILIFAFLYILVDAASNLDEIIGRKVGLKIMTPRNYLTGGPYDSI